MLHAGSRWGWLPGRGPALRPWQGRVSFGCRGGGPRTLGGGRRPAPRPWPGRVSFGRLGPRPPAAQASGPSHTRSRGAARPRTEHPITVKAARNQLLQHGRPEPGSSTDTPTPRGGWLPISIGEAQTQRACPASVGACLRPFARTLRGAARPRTEHAITVEATQNRILLHVRSEPGSSTDTPTPRGGWLPISIGEAQTQRAYPASVGGGPDCSLPISIGGARPGTGARHCGRQLRHGGQPGRTPGLGR